MTTATVPATQVIHYTLDDEPQETTEKVLTPRQIMASAKPVPIDPDTHYLVQIEGRHQISYQGKPDEEIHMHEKMRFVSVSTGPTPVS
jgi:hypothetical protein